jgi:hypothetical protein
MKKLALALSLVPSIALAHPGHHDGGHDAFITNPVLVLALIVGVCGALYRVTRMVRS